ncbi:hypothetical protein NFI96_028840 [Prochilodus magdalenae]|nr:hypothetical protein NFI96_028840 [Prochilodus magdalenae]
MLCRAVLRGLQAAGRRTPLPAPVLPARRMSFGIPVSGTNLAFVVLGGGSLTAALVYAYKTVHSDTVRYNNRIADMEAKLNSQEEEALVDDPAPVAEVTTVHAVAEAEKAPESQEPADGELPGAEVVMAVPAEPAPDTRDAVETAVAVTMMETAAEDTEPAAVEETAVPVATTETVPEAMPELPAVKEVPAA